MPLFFVPHHASIVKTTITSNIKLNCQNKTGQPNSWDFGNGLKNTVNQTNGPTFLQDFGNDLKNTTVRGFLVFGMS